MPDASGNFLQRLAFEHGAPLLYLNAQANFNPIDLARIALHELFHFQYQFGGKFRFKDSYPRNFLETCAKDSNWAHHLNEEFAAWKDFLPRWSCASQVEFKAFAKSIIERRKQGSQFCWNATQFWVRVEGSARFVEIEAALQAEFLDIEQMNLEALKAFDPQSRTVSTGAPNVNSPGINESFFYASGSLYCRLIRKIRPELNWEALI